MEVHRFYDNQPASVLPDVPPGAKRGGPAPRPAAQFRSITQGLGPGAEASHDGPSGGCRIAGLTRTIATTGMRGPLRRLISIFNVQEKKLQRPEQVRDSPENPAARGGKCVENVH